FFQRFKHHTGLECGGVLTVVLLGAHGLAKFRPLPVLISPTTSTSGFFTEFLCCTIRSFSSLLYFLRSFMVTRFMVLRP
ncbi:MAG: hypothetical protein WBB32_04625, partial [Flavobacteriales bacterium]